MSFFTTLEFYRPTKPPVITGESLAHFIRSFEGLKVSDAGQGISLKLKFGDAIDQDEQPTTWDEPVNDVVSVSKEIEWDMQRGFRSSAEVAEALTPAEQPIYRAFVRLGSATADVCQQVNRKNSLENRIDLALDSWALEIEPIVSGSLACEEHFVVGWISVSLSGYGYLFPWKFCDLIERAEGHAGIRQVTDLCKATWPVPAIPPTRSQIDGRRLMGELWPYSRPELPMDWYWGLCETG